MAHGLTIRSDGFVEMGYVEGSETPWHRYGNVWKRGARLPVIAKTAGMDFKILRIAPEYKIGTNRYSVDDRVVLVRSDNHAPLAIVSKDYEVVQPADVFDFFRDLVESVGLDMDTAGTLHGGKRFWALAKIGDRAVLENDAMRGYLLVTTACDYSSMTVAKITCVRVVCQNTLSGALNTASSGGEVKIPHSMKFNAALVQEKLGVAPKSLDSMIRNLNKLAKTPISDRKALSRTEKLFGENSRMVPTVMNLFHGQAQGADLKGFSGTAWGWLNSVTESVDHYCREPASDSHYLNRILFGKGDQTKRAAYLSALEMAS